jgi:hypothetical protein
MQCRLFYLSKNKPSSRTTAIWCVGSIAIWSSVLFLSSCGGIISATNVNPDSPGLSVSPVLPAASVGQNYDATISVSGGTAPYGFSIISGQLPSSLVLGAASGMILGTPSVAGNFSFTILVSDSKGLSKEQLLQIAVSSDPANSFPKLQESAGWTDAGQGPPDFIDCNPCGPQITFSMEQGIGSPSLSGSAAQFDIGGTGPYWDAFFNNHLIGDQSSQGMPDENHTIVPSLHNFTYDVYFYGTNLALSQAIEFDVNQFFDNLGFIWGQECRIAGGNEWDIWDNVNQHWVATGVSCYPNNNSWNHLTIRVQRNANNQLLYQSITLNGVTSTLNQTYDPGSAIGWYGITINYQMDGNYEQSPYSVYLDNLTFTYE